MRRIVLLAALAVAMTTPFTSFAHGGVEKSIDNTTIFLVQNPISPLVGEKVYFNFVFAPKQNTLQRFANLPVTLKVISTYYGDETKDQTIFSKDVTTDNNGSIDFDYVFPRANYYDIELHFTDPVSKQDQATGFLIQVRATQKNRWGMYTASVLILSLITVTVVQGIKSPKKIETKS